jgi:hypothetical protein
MSTANRKNIDPQSQDSVMVQLGLSSNLLLMIDSLRGQMPRAKWIREACEEKVAEGNKERIKL